MARGRTGRVRRERESGLIARCRYVSAVSMYGAQGTGYTFIVRGCPRMGNLCQTGVLGLGLLRVSTGTEMKLPGLVKASVVMKGDEIWDGDKWMKVVGVDFWRDVHPEPRYEFTFSGGVESGPIPPDARLIVR